jgi:hypothetical protein
MIIGMINAHSILRRMRPVPTRLAAHAPSSNQPRTTTDTAAMPGVQAGNPVDSRMLAAARAASLRGKPEIPPASCWRPSPQGGRAVDEPDWKGPLGEAFGSALEYLEGLPARPVGSSASVEELRVALGGPLPEAPANRVR